MAVQKTNGIVRLDLRLHGDDGYPHLLLAQGTTVFSDMIGLVYLSGKQGLRRFFIRKIKAAKV